jgi:hypothetical protein
MLEFFHGRGFAAFRHVASHLFFWDLVSGYRIGAGASIPIVGSHFGDGIEGIDIKWFPALFAGESVSR